MVSRYRGLAGEYMWEREKQLQQDRIRRGKDRPWEHRNQGFNISGLVIAVFANTAALIGLLYLLSTLAE